MGVCESENSSINIYNKVSINGEIKDLSKDNLLENSIHEPIKSKYKIIKTKIGEGSLGKVYIGKDKSGKIYAIKCIKKKKIINGDLFLNEVKMGTKLNHPNILSIKEVFEDKKAIFFVMEYCKGGDLFDFITKSPEGKVNDLMSIDILIQILNAINYLHNEAKICHRDLKPENFLISINEQNKPSIKLIDFGVAQYINKEQRMTEKVGSFKYMAPEIFINQSYNEKIDLWSTGIILYNMITGREPFAFNYDKFKKKPIFNRNINFNLINNLYIRELCQQLLERNPRRRIDAKTALKKARNIKTVLLTKNLE